MSCNLRFTIVGFLVIYVSLACDQPFFNELELNTDCLLLLFSAGLGGTNRYGNLLFRFVMMLNMHLLQLLWMYDWGLNCVAVTFQSKFSTLLSQSWQDLSFTDKTFRKREKDGSEILNFDVNSRKLLIAHIFVFFYGWSSNTKQTPICWITFPCILLWSLQSWSVLSLSPSIRVGVISYARHQRLLVTQQTIITMLQIALTS